MAMNYILAVITIQKRFKKVVLKARCRSISRAVDVTEIIRNKFLPNVVVEDIKTSTDILGKEGGQNNHLRDRNPS